MFSIRLLPFFAACLLGGCTTLSPSDEVVPSAEVRDVRPDLTPFSASAPGGTPAGWAPMALTRAKKATAYRLVRDDGVTVLHAHAAASALMRAVSIDPMARPLLAWRWKVGNLMQHSDNTERATEDSPVRIVLAFDGDKSTLPFADQILFETSKVLSGRELPYATLMYIWEKKAPVGTVIANTRSDRIKMVVATSGTGGVGQWHALSRDIVADYRKAFGDMPGQLMGIGVMTDTDNTGETVDAWYGDIGLVHPLPSAEAALQMP